MTIDVTAMSLPELLAASVEVDAELKRRGHVRTSTSVAGELMEAAAVRLYGGELVPSGTKSIDLITADGVGIQVKVRSLPKGDLRHWSFKDLDFGAAIVVAMDRADLSITWARLLTQEGARALAKPHGDQWRIRMRPARDSGLDITADLRQAYAELDS